MDDATAEKISKTLGARAEFRSFNRSLRQYMERLFPDSELPKEDEARQADEGNTLEGGNQLKGQRFQEEEIFNRGYSYYPAHQSTEKGKHSHEKITDIFGGLKAFFSEGTSLLDIGSGGGQAVDQMRTKYSQGMRIQGVDIRYGIDKPSADLKSPYTTASWKHLPYKESSFDRLLSYESFPRYPFSGDGDTEQATQVFKEITRVAKNGALWRGTLPSMVSGSHFMDGFTQNGWEVYVPDHKLFVARLNKPIQ